MQITLVTIDIPVKKERLFSGNYACPDCGISFESYLQECFHLTTPVGACPTCTGIGYIMKMDENLIIPDKNLTLYNELKLLVQAQ